LERGDVWHHDGCDRKLLAACTGLLRLGIFN
jgi:hypothetical protein